ncbi:hypothetical protein ACT4S2_03360 [Kocuria turfanensis]|uniref:hypothetical protein n=1 Tax=Kocuria turfanensis TaxID=388357 RepID=UPI004035EE97
MRTRSEGWVQLGLRGIFRKNSGDGTSQETAPEGRPAAPPAEQTGPGGVEGRAGAPVAPGREHEAHGAGEARPVPPEGPLAVLVERLTSRGADRAVLTLVQRGNTMTHQTEQSVGDVAPSVESGTVDQDSPLFDPVADLYSEAMSSPRGAWQNARIEVGPEQDGVRPVVTTYGFADGAEDVQTWRSGRPTPPPPASAVGTDGDERPGDRAAGAPAHEQRPDERWTEDSGARSGTGAPEAAAQDAEAPDSGAPAAAEPAPATGATPVITEVDGPTGSSAAPSGPSAAGAAPGTAPGTDDAQRVPDHVDHEEWHEDVEPPAPTGAGAAAAAAVAAGTSTGEEQDSSAPETAVSTDVSPSYRAPSGATDRPSQDALAEGNLVLKEADVLRRLAAAQRRLFGPDGTAMDVSTVLVRIRALGTYYDALTHVRKNGFWDQRRTFDLIPEDLLHVQQFKDESYVEGTGAPLAMMFRFRPGIPPEVSFDYADEEAFVRYEERLPAQNYLEELRMYPRTGANIPQHMNEALQDWNY